MATAGYWQRLSASVANAGRIDRKATCLARVEPVAGVRATNSLFIGAATGPAATPSAILSRASFRASADGSAAVSSIGHRVAAGRFAVPASVVSTYGAGCRNVDGGEAKGALVPDAVGALPLSTGPLADAVWGDFTDAPRRRTTSFAAFGAALARLVPYVEAVPEERLRVLGPAASVAARRAARWAALSPSHLYGVSGWARVQHLCSTNLHDSLLAVAVGRVAPLGRAGYVAPTAPAVIAQWVHATGGAHVPVDAVFGSGHGATQALRSSAVSAFLSQHCDLNVLYAKHRISYDFASATFCVAGL